VAPAKLRYLDTQPDEPEEPPDEGANVAPIPVLREGREARAPRQIKRPWQKTRRPLVWNEIRRV